MLRDDDFGVVRLRAFGTYDFKVADAKRFLAGVSGSDQDFRVAEFSDTMRSRLVSLFTNSIAAAKIPMLDVASRYREIGDAILPLINAVAVPQYGLEITSFVVENVSAPAEVEQAIDKRASTAVIGNMNEYVRYQVGRGVEAGGGGGGTAGTAAELAVGFGMAQQMMQGGAGGAGLPELLSPADAAKSLGVSESDVITVLESGELKGKKIGSTWRIPRAALNTYLTQ
jgi:excisionase family DNA binding protein